MDLKSKLRKALGNYEPPKLSEEEKTEQDLEQFTKLYVTWKGESAASSKTYTKIPRFYYRLPAEDEILLQKLREESRAVFLQRKSRYVCLNS